jgi:DNA-binding LytR/AlgR family response regulator
MQIESNASKRKKPIFLKEKAPTIKVGLDDILWIEAIGGLISVHTTEERFTVRETIKEIMERLPSDKFVRVHRSFVVPIDKITQLNDKTLVIGNRMISIGDAYRDELHRNITFS